MPRAIRFLYPVCKGHVSSREARDDDLARLAGPSRGDKKPAMVVLRDEGIYPECHRPDSALSGPRLHAPRPDAARDDGDAGRARLAASRGATAGRPLRGAASLIQPRRRIPRSGGALRHGRQDARARLHVRNKAPLDAAAPARAADTRQSWAEAGAAAARDGGLCDAYWTVRWMSGATEAITLRDGCFSVYGHDYEIHRTRERGYFFEWGDGTVQTLVAFNNGRTITWSTTHPDYPCIWWERREPTLLEAQAEARAAQRVVEAVGKGEAPRVDPTASAPAAPVSVPPSLPPAGQTAGQGRTAMMPSEQVQAFGAALAELRQLRQKIIKDCRDVGDNFAEEARKIHYGETEPEGIYGKATAEEREALDEEGIAVADMPWLPRDN